MRRRLFLAGATGAIGRQLLPLLLENGYDVAGMTRTESKAADLEAAGARPVVCDVFDRERLGAAVEEFQPEIVMHQLTDLPDELAQLPEYRGRNNRIRTEGTRNLVDAARAAGAGRFLAQSVAWELPGDGGDAVREHEAMVLEVGGVVVRYGQFYGPLTYSADRPTHKGAMPIVHVADAAARTVGLIDAPSGIVEIVES
jgi:nucleoside-diphosphate-sugar epimerase